MNNSLRTQLVRFILVGCLSAVVDFGVLWLLMFFGMDHTPAKALSFVAGTLTAYMLNRRYTFTSEGSWQKFAATMATYIVTFVVQVGIFDVLYPVLEDLGGRTFAQIGGFVVAQGTATIVNFIVQRTLIFADRTPPPRDDDVRPPSSPEQR